MRAIEKLIKELGNDGEQVLKLLYEASNTITYYKRLLEHYEFDALTGLPGRTKFHEFIEGIESRYNTVGVVFFDVNELKECNDNHGHQAGDQLLLKAAESIVLIADKNTHVFRIGGDEFVAILTDCTESEGKALIPKWRRGLAELNTRNDGIKCSIAAGMAFGSGKYSISDLLKAADDNMYEDKHRMKAEH